MTGTPNACCENQGRRQPALIRLLYRLLARLSASVLSLILFPFYQGTFYTGQLLTDAFQASQ
jgi:hypothetical protein